MLHHTRARSRAKKGGALEACRTPSRYISGLAKDTVLSTSGVGVAGPTRAPAARPRAGLFSMTVRGQNVVSGSLWLAFSSCSSPLAEILKYRYYFSFSLCERRHYCAFAIYKITYFLVPESTERFQLVMFFWPILPAHLFRAR